MNKQEKALEKLRSWTERTDVVLPVVFQVSFTVEELKLIEGLLTDLAKEAHENSFFLTNEAELPEYARKMYRLSCTALSIKPDPVLLGEVTE